VASILLVVKHAELDAHNAKVMVDVARDTATSDTPIRSAKGAAPAGHERRLRGFPIYVRGVTGVQHGSKPGTSNVRQARENETSLLSTKGQGKRAR
jgi:hypothetical protein